MEAAAEAMRQREIEEENKKVSMTPRFVWISMRDFEMFKYCVFVNRGKIYTPGRRDPGTPKRTPARFGI